MQSTRGAGRLTASSPGYHADPGTLLPPDARAAQLAFTPTRAVRPGQGTAGRKITVKANWFKAGGWLSGWEAEMGGWGAKQGQPLAGSEWRCAQASSAPPPALPPPKPNKRRWSAA